MPDKKILIIDDDPDILELFSYNLTKEGYHVLTAPTSLNAMWKLEDGSLPDAILLDLMLPTVDGLEICHFLKSSNDFRDIPVIIVSARGSREDIRKGFAAGADAYLPKSSFSMATLLNEIQTAVGQ